ncbi:MAG: tRNA adenosine(34) deaminase TadA [Solobacterium sp.]|nr:tRNA adenosine(34) deaminase TadA [Solobacterium sp.]
MKTHEDFMRIALKEAEKAAKIDEVPIGCVIVKDGEVISKAHNMKEHQQLSTSHAEILAIQKASRKLNTWNLKDCDLYVTLEPCMMCTGSIILSRIHAIYYGTNDPKGGCVNTLIDINQIKKINHHPNIYSGILKEECSEILSSFFRQKRMQKKDIKNTTI